MMGLEVVADMGGMWQEATQNVATGMSGLGATELADSTQRAADALDVMAGAMQIVSGIATIMTTLNAKAAAQAVAGTAANATNPIGWGKIAIALAAAGVAAAVTYPLVRNYTLKADLSKPSEVQGVVQKLGVLT